MRYIVFPRLDLLPGMLQGSISHVVYPRLEMRFPVICSQHGRVSFSFSIICRIVDSLLFYYLAWLPPCHLRTAIHSRESISEG